MICMEIIFNFVWSDGTNDKESLWLLHSFKLKIFKRLGGEFQQPDTSKATAQKSLNGVDGILLLSYDPNIHISNTHCWLSFETFEIQNTTKFIAITGAQQISFPNSF